MTRVKHGVVITLMAVLFFGAFPVSVVADNGTIGVIGIGYYSSDTTTDTIQGYAFNTTYPPCSSGCTCMGEKNANNQGRVPCYRYSNMSGVICGINQLGENMYCYSDTIPITTPLPTASGRTLTPTPSLTTTSQTTTPATGSAIVLSGCGPDCRCILPDAADSLGLPLCSGSPVLCNYDASGRGMYCYALAQRTALPATSGTSGSASALTSCSGDCTCLDAATASQVGLTLCGGTPVLCNYDANKNPMYCYNRAGGSSTGQEDEKSSAAGIPLGAFTILGAVGAVILLSGLSSKKKY
ncbi:MAG: hypothetical protein MUE45_07175 [Methanoregulaceae archaeon]|nr:hypothetical protein [Methanoregulaceae archaeon]